MSEVSNCVIANNSADYGGGFYNRDSNVSILNVTISQNSAVNTGGGLYCADPNTTIISNSILWGNTAPDCNEIVLSNFAEMTIDYSDVQGGIGSVCVDSNSVLNWGEGNIDADPLFIGIIGYHKAIFKDTGRGRGRGVGGGEEPSDIPIWDYHLLPDSPCIDVGDPNSVYSLEPEPDGGRVNMGAYGNTTEATSKGGLVIRDFDYDPPTGGGGGGGVIVTNKIRVGRTTWQYICTVRMDNVSSSAVENVQLELLGVSSNMTIIDPSVSFAFIDAWGTAVSDDTCAFEVDRSVAIDTAEISWVATYDIVSSGAGSQQMSSTTILLEQLSVLGDITGEGDINTADLIRLAEKWLWTGTPGSIAEDIAPPPNGDGKVDLLDFALVLENWRK